MSSASPSIFEARRRQRAQFFQDFVVEALERKGGVGKFEGVRHAADAVNLLDHHEFPLDRRAVHLLGTAEDVLDDLEDVGVGRQREHQHDHAADAGCHDELVFRVVQVIDEIAEEHRLALLAEAEHDIQLGVGLVGQDGAQELDVAGRHFHIDHEIGPRQRKEQADPPGIEEDGVKKELAAVVMDDGNREGVFGGAVDRLADDVGGLVAVEGGTQHLNLEVHLARRHALQIAANGVIDVVGVALEVGEWSLPLEIPDDLADRAAQAILHRVVAAVGGRDVGFDILGGQGRANEHEIVAEIVAVQDLGRHRVEEGFGQFRLLVVEQQADVEQLDLLPGGVVDLLGVELDAQALDTFIDAVIVETDALLYRLVHAHPVGLLEAGLGLLAGGAEQCVVLVEALDQRKRDLVGAGAVEADGNLHRERF